MKTLRIAALCLFAVPGMLAATPSVAATPEPVVAIDKELHPALKTLCADIRAEVKKAEAAKTAPGDLATLVLGTLGEKNTHFSAFVDGISKLPPEQRHDAFKRSISKAMKAEWKCPEFDTMWGAK
jgi:hypothetical protein